MSHRKDVPTKIASYLFFFILNVIRFHYFIYLFIHYDFLLTCFTITPKPSRQSWVCLTHEISRSLENSISWWCSLDALVIKNKNQKKHCNNCSQNKVTQKPQTKPGKAMWEHFEVTNATCIICKITIYFC